MRTVPLSERRSRRSLVRPRGALVLTTGPTRFELERGAVVVDVGRRVADLTLSPNGGPIAALRRRNPPGGLQALDVGDGAQRTSPLVRRRPEQQPGNRLWVRRIRALDDFADDFAAVIGLPGWAAVVLPDLFAVVVPQIGDGCLERPVE